MPTKAVAQLAFDEQVINDPTIEAALEKRQAAKVDLADVRAEYTKAHDAAMGKVAELELPEGGAARVGRFRVTRTAVAARSVSFEAAATSRVRISLADEE